MYTIKIREHFSSAHNLRGYKGKCEELHGHNWEVEAAVSSEELDRTGMVMDFKDLKGILSGILSELDHKHLNVLEPFKELNPTSENIAKYIHGRLRSACSGAEVRYVTVWETEKASATYSL
ncbi:MAG: 6-carboxytetrahydropterin synthase QueD [Candidatus Omnitrophota bacterium]